ncbi:DUF3857 domain-containing protein [Maribacter sp. 2304DJ31-5]|uniref:DUF3857 domain-containing protein n=1 Tax=Maribacter sp. 2304DJ31-5 TaxID=3386273 RepID=UPI0039BC89B5
MIKQIAIVVFLFLMASVMAQDVKFGKVSKAELEEKIYAKDSAAPAVVSYRKIDIFYRYIQNSGFQVVTEVHERIKIYNKDGFDYATVSERLYTGGNDKETFSGLKAYTYSLENGEVVKTKLKSSDTFSKELSKYYDEEKFTMPNVKEGSVIEYQYKISSPYSYSIDEIVLQYDIPIRKQQVFIAIPEYYSFKPNMKGYLPLDPKYSMTTSKITFTNKERTTNGQVTGTRFSTSAVDYKINKTTYAMEDVPALKEEPFVNNMDNYRSSINYEIEYVKFPNSAPKSYATNWEKVVKAIYDNDNFGRQLEIARYFKDDLPAILQGKASALEKITAIFSFVQRRMNWNGYIGKYADEGVVDAYKKKSGSAADINLMLVAMLKKAGLRSNPVLVSTRDNGVPLFPTREGFNYVLAAVELEGQNILLDACNKYTEPNLLPVKAINWSGRIIKEDGSSNVVPIVPDKASKKLTMMNVNLKENGDIEGRKRETSTFYNAYLFRNRNNGINEDDYLERKENDNNGMEISDYEIKGKTELGKPIVETYSFFVESQSDVIGDKIYFSPLFFHAEDENPFKLEKRDYPIDFVFPWQEKYTVNILIPEGYQVTSVPQSINLVLPGQMGSFLYKILHKDNKLQIVADVKMNQAIIPAGDYDGIKELYKKIVEKEAEKVVLSKI